jgi:hypothetical protein
VGYGPHEKGKPYWANASHLPKRRRKKTIRSVFPACFGNKAP